MKTYPYVNEQPRRNKAPSLRRTVKYTEHGGQFYTEFVWITG